MKLNDIKKLVANSIGVQTDNADLVYRVFTKKIANKLNSGEAVKIKELGTFHLSETKVDTLETENIAAGKLIFIPAGENIFDVENEKHFASLSITAQKESSEFNPESIFDIGVSRSLISTSELGGKETSLKMIEEKIDELLNNSETINDYDLWSESKIAEVKETTEAEEEPAEHEADDTSEVSAAESPEIDDPFILPDFKSIEDDFAEEADAGIEIVSEDDIIVPGAEKVKSTEDESDEEIISDEEQLTETTDIVEEQPEEEENLEDLFKEFDNESDTNFETPAADVLTDSFETPGMETPSDIELEEDKIGQSIDNADDVEKLDSDDELESIEKLSDDRERLGGEDEVPDEIIDDEKDDEKDEENDTTFEKADEDFGELKDSDQLNALDDFDEEIKESVDELNSEDLNLEEDEFEVENPKFEEEDIETRSASVEDIFDDSVKRSDDNELQTADEEDEIAGDIDEENIEDDEFDLKDEENIEPTLNDLPEEGEKILEPLDEEKSYSNLRGSESKTSLGKGFWISVMVFVVVVVIGAYLYLFVYDSSTNNSQNETVLEQPAEKPAETPPPPPPKAEETGEPKSIEEIKKELADKRDIVKIQGTGDTGFYRDGSDEINLGGGIFNKNGLYSVQVSSFKTQSVAEEQAKKLQERGFDAFIVKAFVQKFNADYYRVRVGYFNSKKEAENFQKEF